MRDIALGSHKVGPHYPPLIVAELSGNHGGSLEKALELVDAVKKAGVPALKIQTYTPDTITLDVKNDDFLISDPTSPWNGRYLHDLYQEAHTPWEWHEPIFRRCRELGLLAFSSPFDETAVDFLEELDVPCYKIASFEIVDHPLIEKVAATGKPLIMSTGMASTSEIQEAVSVARHAGCDDIILLKCTSGYPTPPSEAHLRTLPQLTASFGTLVGLSDHTLSLGVPIASVAMGACLIEKHFTLSRTNGGVDSAFSLEPHEFRVLVDESKNAWEALGDIHYGPSLSENASRRFRPSLYFVQDLQEGETLQAHHVRTVRPSYGLPPKELPYLLGKTLKQSVTRGTAVSYSILK